MIMSSSAAVCYLCLTVSKDHNIMLGRNLAEVRKGLKRIHPSVAFASSSGKPFKLRTINWRPRSEI
jgi:hypothetical protein